MESFGRSGEGDVVRKFVHHHVLVVLIGVFVGLAVQVDQALCGIVKRVAYGAVGGAGILD